MKVRVVGRGVMKVVGGRTPPERGRSVFRDSDPNFLRRAARAAVRVGRPDRIENAADRDREALGQRRLQTPLTLSAAAAIKRCHANMAHAAPVAEGGRMVQPDDGGWSDRVVGRERAIWVVGWSDRT